MLKERYYTEPTEMDTRVFDTLVPPDHYLRRVKRLIDFERLRDLITDCYSPAMGRTAEDPVRLIKLAFLQFHYNLSDREVIAAAQVNVAFRYFLDLSLASRLPVPSLLAQFRTRMGAQRHQALFDQVVTQARAYAPELNPDEGVWQQLKGVELRNLCCFDLRHLRDELRTAVKRVRRKPRILKGCFAGAGL